MTPQDNSTESATQPEESGLVEGAFAEPAPDPATSTLARCLEIIAAQAGEIMQLREEMALL